MRRYPPTVRQDARGTHYSRLAYNHGGISVRRKTVLSRLTRLRRCTTESGGGLLLLLTAFFIWGSMLAGCGQKDPDIIVVGETGTLVVLSTPDSAAIRLDEQITGLFTPSTITDVSVGSHTVRVVKTEYTPRPDSLLVEILSGQSAYADFELDPILPRPALLESFTNVSCGPCADINHMMYELLDELGIDQAVLMEFHTQFPSPLDPFYLEQRVLMDARMALYNVAQAPWLIIEGVAGMQPGTESQVRAALDEAHLAQEVDLGLLGSIEGTALSCSLRAQSLQDEGAYLLNVFVTQDQIEFEEPPGTNGETLFRHVVRGVMPGVAGESAELTTATPVWFAWETTLPWRTEDEMVRLIAVARSTSSSEVKGLDVLELP